MITLFTDTYMHHQVLMSSSEYQAYKIQGIKLSQDLTSWQTLKTEYLCSAVQSTHIMIMPTWSNMSCNVIYKDI